MGNPNIAARLIERASHDPDRPAIIECHGRRVRRVTFGELAGRAAGMAGRLREQGLAPGDRVLLFVPMSIDLYTAIVACLSLGAVVLFVDAWADRRRLDAAVTLAGPKAFIGTPRTHLLRLLSRAIQQIPLHLVMGAPLGLGNKESSCSSSAIEVPGDAPALITFTTGSTGGPKAAARSHAFLWAQHQALADYLGLTETDIDLPTLPIFVLNNLALGVTSVLPDFDPRRPAAIDPAAIYEQLVTQGVTTSSGSPVFYDRLARWCAGSGRRLPLRALFTGGAPVLPPLARLLADITAGSVHVVYGSTEAEPIAGIEAREMLAAMAIAEGKSRPEGICVGRPVAQVTVRLIRPWDGPVTLGEAGWSAWEVPPGEVGEIVVTGAHVLTGYLNDPEADRENKIRDGGQVWHRTGDAAWMDSDDRLWLMGRVNARVRRAGGVWWGIPAEVRALSLAGITHAAYLGFPDPELGERAVLCVETAAGRLSDTERERLLAALAPMPVDALHSFRRIPRDPRHASKTDTETLRRLLLSGRHSREIARERKK